DAPSPQFARSHLGRRFLWFALGFGFVGVMVAVWAVSFGKDGTGDQKQSPNAMTFEMPGKSFSGPLPELSAEMTKLRDSLKQDVAKLATDIGERNLRHYAKLMEAAAFVENSLTAAGYQVERQTYDVKGQACVNLQVEIKGTKRPDEIVVIGA